MHMRSVSILHLYVAMILHIETPSSGKRKLHNHKKIRKLHHRFRPSEENILLSFPMIALNSSCFHRFDF